jgi:transcriptional regulator with XRE-family HTH domain
MTTATSPRTRLSTPDDEDGPAVGRLLRGWRERRRLSQLELSLQAEVSTRHLSFIETGRSKPTSEMIMRLTEHLDVPLRERNALLLAGGYAPAYPEHDLGAPALSSVMDALRALLDGHEPYPAVVVDAEWNLVDANSAVLLLTEGAAPELLEPPVNALRLALHPKGMAPRIRNHAQWRAHILERLERQATATADPALFELKKELEQYPHPKGDGHTEPRGSVVVPLRYEFRGTELSLLSTTTVFGTPRDVTVSELAIESFFPADAATAEFLRSRS